MARLGVISGSTEFERVSACVQATYGLAVVIAHAAGVKAFVAPLDVLRFGVLSRLIVVGLIGGIGFAWVVPMLRHNPRI